MPRKRSPSKPPPPYVRLKVGPTIRATAVEMAKAERAIKEVEAAKDEMMEGDMSEVNSVKRIAAGATEAAARAQAVIDMMLLARRKVVSYRRKL